MIINYRENGGKAFPVNPKPNILYLNTEIVIVVAITKRIKIIMSIQVCLISQINFDYKENRGKKNFSCKLIASKSCIAIRRT